MPIKHFLNGTTRPTKPTEEGGSGAGHSFESNSNSGSVPLGEETDEMNGGGKKRRRRQTRKNKKSNKKRKQNKRKTLRKTRRRRRRRR